MKSKNFPDKNWRINTIFQLAGRFWSLLSPHLHIHQPVLPLPFFSSFCRGFGKDFYWRGQVLKQLRLQFGATWCGDVIRDGGRGGKNDVHTTARFCFFLGWAAVSNQGLSHFFKTDREWGNFNDQRFDNKSMLEDTFLLKRQSWNAMTFQWELNAKWLCQTSSVFWSRLKLYHLDRSCQSPMLQQALLFKSLHFTRHPIRTWNLLWKVAQEFNWVSE